MIKIGDKYRCKKSLHIEDILFIKDEIYKLIDIIEEEEFTLYIFEDNMFGDFYNEFNDIFISLEEERVIILNKLIYED